MVERVRAICKAKGIPVSQLEKDLGYANGYLNPKKAEAIRKDRIAEIAQYLGVSLSDIDENSTDNWTVEALQSLRDVDRLLMEEARNANLEDVQAARDYLNYLKGLRNDRGD
jgi:transcriptional regulator with XRE-family HTH domain